MSRMIWACINCYEDDFLIEDCIRSVRSSIPGVKIVAVDGAYSAFNIQAKVLEAQFLNKRQKDVADCFRRYIEPQSKDKTLEILKRNNVEVIIETKEAWENEHVKRSKYFVGNKGDFYFVIDSDERLIGQFPTWEVLDMSNHWCVMLTRDDMPTKPYPILRGHHHVDGMHYDGAHHALFCDGNLVKRVDYENDWVLPNCWLDHRWAERAVQNNIRHQIKGAYYKYLLEAEDIFRRTNGI